MRVAMVGLGAIKASRHPGSVLVAGCVSLVLICLSASGLVWAQSPTPQSSSHSPAITATNIVLPQYSGASLTANRRVYSLGEPADLTFKVTNTTKKPIRYDFASGQQVDFTVADSKGNTVWDSSGQKVSFRGITHLTLAPGKSQLYQMVWNQRDQQARPVPPGAYTVTAKLMALPRVEISGGLIVNTDSDPANIGAPTKSKSESGATIQQDVTPSVAAATQITVKGR